MALKVIVAGLGPRGLEWAHEVGRAQGFELAACADVDAEVLRRASSKLDLPPARCFSSLEAAAEKSDCDAAIIATPAEQHARGCEVALSRGLAVLVEKPFTTSVEDASRVVRLAELKGLPVVVGQNYRYMRAFRTARRLVAEGALGRVGLINCQYYRVPHEMAASLASAPHRVLWGMGVHHLDALRHILNGKVTGVAADSFTLPWGTLPPGASLRVMLDFEDGARALYSATYESSGHEFFERGQEFYLRLVGERATLHVFQRWLALCERGRWPRVIRRGRRETTEEQILLSQFRRALETGDAPESSGRDNLQTVAVAEACVRAAAERRWVNPQELLDESD